MESTERFTIADWAEPAEAEAACRAVLRAVWPTLRWLEVDLAGLPEDHETAAAVAQLLPYRTRSVLRRVTDCAHVVPGRDDAVLDAVLDVAGKTIGSTGLSRSNGRMVYDANDGASSCVFHLTDGQRDQAERRLRDDGVREHLLVVFRG